MRVSGVKVCGLHCFKPHVQALGQPSFCPTALRWRLLWGFVWSFALNDRCLAVDLGHIRVGNNVFFTDTCSSRCLHSPSGYTLLIAWIDPKLDER